MTWMSLLLGELFLSSLIMFTFQVVNSSVMAQLSAHLSVVGLIKLFQSCALCCSTLCVTVATMTKLVFVIWP